MFELYLNHDLWVENGKTFQIWHELFNKCYIVSSACITSWIQLGYEGTFDNVYTAVRDEMAIGIKVIVSADNKWQSWRLWNHRATAVTVIYSLITWCHQNTFEVCCHLYYVIWTSHCKRECFMINRPLVFICSKQTTGCNLRPSWSATHVMLWCCCVVYWYSGVFTRSSIRHASSISPVIKIYV